MVIDGALKQSSTIRKLTTKTSMGNASIDTSASEESLVEFDIYERQGFDRIVKTVAGSSEEAEEEYAKKICDMLEIFERLSAQT